MFQFKRYSFFNLKLLFSSVFLLSYLISFSLTSLYKEHLIEKELDLKVKELQLHIDITNLNNMRDAKSVSSSLQGNKRVVDILFQVKSANEKQRDLLRAKLYKLLSYKYKIMKQRGILQFQFVLPNNISFLRMHKPSKYGDFLGDVRYTFSYTNKTHKSIFGFEQGKTAHAFRNVFPLFKDDIYLGAYEISYTSESIQENLLKINKIHSHFLVNKNIFKSKIWNRKNQIQKYIPSIEHKDYMFAVIDTTNHFDLKTSQEILIKPHKICIDKGVASLKKFAIYENFGEFVKVVAFVPIKDVKNKDILAYIVSYTKSESIVEILNNFKYINILLFFSLAIIFYLLYKQLVYKKFLKTEINRKTESLKELNNTLEYKVKVRTEEQNQLLSLFDKGAITIFKWKNDKIWSIEYVSSNVQELIGYTKDEFFNVNIEYSKLINNDDITQVTKEVSDAIKFNTEFFIHKPYRILTKDSETKWVYDATSILKNSDGEITHFLGYIIDITEMKTLELKLSKLNENLQDEVQKEIQKNLQKDKILQEQVKLVAMGEMVGAIAHQWRQPLNSLNINIQNLDDDYEDGLIDSEFIDNFIAKQTKTIQFMSNTIDDFRNFFRVDKIKKVFSVKEAIETTVSIQLAQLKNSNISLEIIGEDFEIDAIESEFKQVILNLITNAKDALEDKKISNGKILISLEKEKIVISDNGEGIPEDIIDRIFEPYFTTKEQGKGTGIGLYMSKMIIEQNIGGSLSVKNNGGAEFTIRLI